MPAEDWLLVLMENEMPLPFFLVWVFSLVVFHHLMWTNLQIPEWAVDYEIAGPRLLQVKFDNILTNGTNKSRRIHYLTRNYTQNKILISSTIPLLNDVALFLNAMMYYFSFTNKLKHFSVYHMKLTDDFQ